MYGSGFALETVLVETERRTDDRAAEATRL